MLIRTIENTFIVRFQNATESTFIKGTHITEILEYARPQNSASIVLAKISNEIYPLRYPLEDDCTLEWLLIQSPEGLRSYQHTLCFILDLAIKDIFSDQQLLIDHSLGTGLYCELQGKGSFRKSDLKKITKRIRELIEENALIEPLPTLRAKALQLLEQNGVKPTLFAGNPEQLRLILYQCKDRIDYFGYPLFPSTNYLNAFELHCHPPGFVLQLPAPKNPKHTAPFNPQKKLFAVFQEYRHWEKIFGIQKVADINEAVASQRISELLKIAEGLHEKRITEIAKVIEKKRNHVRIILIAGPSSSGKTTFTKRLHIHLKVNGLDPLPLSLDDYFVDREHTPRDPEGNYNFESIDAIDTNRLDSDIRQLLLGKQVRLPRYDFKLGMAIPGDIYQLKPKQPILIEGLHGLNHRIARQVHPKNKLKIYVSALTQLNVTDRLRVATSDVRLLRRMVRDHKFRNHSVVDTLERWPLVRTGEEYNIFPLQEEAQIIFNSSLMYELTVLRVRVAPLLESVSQDNTHFAEAQRLLNLLLHFLPVRPEAVPSDSILREFIGGSSYSY